MTRVTVIRGGLLIDGRGGSPLPDALVRIEGDRVAAVGPATAFGAPADAVEIDARGLTLIPGLIDMHVHLMHEPERLAPLCLQSGVTTVRDTGGPLPALVEWRAAALAGTRVSPRLFFCGPLLDLAPPVHPGVTATVDSPDSAYAEVDRIAEAGASWIKIYVQVAPHLAATIIRRAREHGLPATGDLGATTATEAIAAGIVGLEHASVAYGDLVPAEQQAPFSMFHEQGPAAWRRRWNRGFAAVDPSGPAARALARRIADRGVYFDPTLVVLERMSRLDEPEVTDAPEVALMPEAIRSMWEARASGRKQVFSAEDYEQSRRSFRTALAFTGEVLRAGGTLLVGTDTPNPYVVPGVSLHHELALLVEAGMSPMAALVAATHTNAQALGAQRDLGTIEPGKLADLVLLDANPLEDIRHSRRVRLVLQGGAAVAGSLATNEAVAG